MTREEILAMPAGPNLDALVAERVMGWRWFKLRKEHRLKGDYHHYDGESVWVTALVKEGKVLRELIFGKEPSGPYCSPPPAYSADIQAAWEIVEKLCMSPNYRDFRLGYDCGMSGVEIGKWYTYFPGPTDATGETAPLAICRAALLSVMEGEDEVASE